MSVSVLLCLWSHSPVGYQLVHRALQLLLCVQALCYPVCAISSVSSDLWFLPVLSLLLLPSVLYAVLLWFGACVKRERGLWLSGLVSLIVF